MTLRKAMAKSVNSITAFMTKKLSPTTVVNYAKKLGIQSKLDPVPQYVWVLVETYLYLIL